MMRLTCVSCGKSYEPTKGRYICDVCGPLYGTLEVHYHYDEIQLSRSAFSKTGSLFQFSPLLPVQSQTPIDHAIGGTPLLAFEGHLGLKRLLIKNDGMQFSGSFKDRASVIAMNHALALGYDTIYCASTGNAASSLAILTAHSPLKTMIYVPSQTPKGKLAQIIASGATLVKVEGTYDEAFDLAYETGECQGWYCRSSAINPFLIEGKKTAAFEILVQNDYVVPDVCLVSVGDGTVISALIKGFSEFKTLGLVDKMPRMIGVQAEGAAALKRVFDAGRPYTPLVSEAKTLADSICVGNPRDVIKACVALESCDGMMVTVSDDDIVSAMFDMAQATGVFAEPAGAAPYAALKALIRNRILTETDEAVLVVTGSGLKDPSAVLRR